MSQSGLIQEQIKLAPFTSWRVGGNAEFFSSPKNLDEVEASLLWAGTHGHSVTVLGGGSNILVSDKGVSGLVLSMRQLAGMDVKLDDSHLRATVMAGTHKSQLLRLFLQHKLAPALFLSGLPGDVGGGIVMNAGVSEKRIPREFCEIIEWIEVMRLVDAKVERITYQFGELEWKYRHSKGWQPGVVVRAGLMWPNRPDESVPLEVREANKLRLSKQPLDQPSCGSVFVNPPGHSAGALIDQCELKGFSYGGAKVSEKHANFIVNYEGATAADIDAIIKFVQKNVFEKKSIMLTTEVIYLGDWN